MTAYADESTTERLVGGPYFDDLTVGQMFRAAPSLTLTEAHAVTHQAIIGDRLRLPLDRVLCERVAGRAPLAHPALVWDLSIGQSTLATQRVKANVFYRGLVFRRLPAIGDTLYTETKVVVLRQNRVRAGRAPTGLAVLRVSTVDQQNRPILSFLRCAMLPLRHDPQPLGPNHHLATEEVTDSAALRQATENWRLLTFRTLVPGPHFRSLRPGDAWAVDGGDVVSSAPELARLTLNIAKVHHDAAAGGGSRLVYGGHTIGVALAQATRALPSMVSVVGWHGCDHLGPVAEGDTLYSTLAVERTDPLEDGGGLVHLRSRVRAQSADGEAREVLDWRFVALFS